MTENEIKNATPDQLVEEGIGLIARGLYRAEKQGGTQAAYDLGRGATAAVRATWFDFVRVGGKTS